MLAGCSLKAKWQDTTGQGRTNEQAQADARECYQAAGVPQSAPTGMTSAEFEGAIKNAKACMLERGWKFVSVEKNSN
jgi:hypothetical protein